MKRRFVMTNLVMAKGCCCKEVGKLVSREKNATGRVVCLPYAGE